ncbi:hypothetical protein Leryth_026072 [Lithospermum erythrorhizon]|nr:hypothetical protein Leryth_026072 [Lithospermum erythrorhizon]
MSLVANEDFQHILRIQNTNVDGKQKVMFAMTSIKGIGRRFANIVCKKADVDMNKRAGELSAAEIDNIMTSGNHRGLRHYWGLRVRGQHTKTTGRRGKTVGVSKKR